MTRSQPATPYVGLVPYNEEDAEFFFGREKEKEAIAANLMCSRLTLIHGRSGVGKSSLLRAGVVNDLRRLSRKNLDEYGTPGFAVVYFDSWRDDPIPSLSARVQESVSFALDMSALEPVPHSTSLHQMLEAWTERLGLELLIILDQFEEYFLYRPHEDGDGTFAMEFPKALNHPSLRVNFAISIREDALARLARFKGRIPNPFDNYLEIKHLEREAARTAIEKPIEEYNRRYASSEPFSIEPALTDEVLDQVVVDPDGSRTEQIRDTGIEAPYLQLVMTRLWQKEIREGSRELRLQTLSGLEGLRNIVRVYLREAMNALEPAEQESAFRIFDYLVTPSGTKIAYVESDLVMKTGIEPANIALVLEKLNRSRILRPVDPPRDRPEEMRYEVFHDILAKAILSWQQEYEVRREERESREQEQKQAARLREIERNRFMKWGFLASIFVIAIVVWLALNLHSQYKQSRSRELALGARENLRFNPELSVLLARAALESSESDEAKQAMRLSLVAAHPYLLFSGDTRINSAAFSPNGNRIVTAGDKAAKVWDSKTGMEVATLVGHEGTVVSASFSPDGKYVLTAAALPDQIPRVWNASTGELVVRLEGHTAPVSLVIMSPDGKHIATEGQDRTGIIWDAQTGELRFRLEGLGGPVAAMAFSPDSKRLVTESGDLSSESTENNYSAKVWNVETGKPQLNLPHRGPVTAVAFTPNGKYVVTASNEKVGGVGTRSAEVAARLWDVETGKVLNEMIDEGAKDHVINLAVSPDGLRIATSDNSGDVKIWNIHGGRPLRTLDSAGDIGDVPFSPDSTLLVTRGGIPSMRQHRLADLLFARAVPLLDRAGDLFAKEGSSLAKVWDISSGKEIVVLTGHKGSISTVAFSPVGKSVLTASQDTTARVWDLNTNQEIIRLADPSTIRRATITGDGKYLFILQSDIATLWRTGAQSESAKLTNLPPIVQSVTLSPNGQHVVVLGTDDPARSRSTNVALLWNTNDGSSNQKLEHKGAVVSAAFSADGKYLVTSSEDKTARVWNASNGELIAPLEHDKRVAAAQFSPDDKYIVTASGEAARVWDITTQQQVGKPLEPGLDVIDARFSPNGKWLATTGLRKKDGGQLVHVWEAKSRKRHSELSTDKWGPVLSMAFSGDGERILTVSGDNVARLWETDSGWLISELRGHEGRIMSAVFTPDMQWIVTAGDDRSVRLWDKYTGDLVQVFRGHNDTVYSAIGFDGNKVISVSRDGYSRILVCDVCGSVARLLQLADERVKRQPDDSERRKYKL